MNAAMNLFFVAAAALIVALGAAHSYLGERLILVKLFRDHTVPAILGSPRFTMRTLRFTWHLTTVMMWSSAAILLVADRTVALVLAWTYLICAVVAAAGSRFRHFSWGVFLLCAALVWWGAR